ncbi:hypothetical protein KIH74_21470 [Kineosporia sp. J2-2]|uniref:SCP2 domain-containing protein n=1 Tax=Kineosporia corallincola TaxID=2835133 RepID=A0ABS5TKA3_9ACTN|nr:hypothetical protein [Kineosporia corallincola]MBT0771522.1 hypothetical protein [Kineosporia corallincola]
MLTEVDPRVTAQVNLDAVLGALPLLTRSVPEAAALLRPLAKPVTLRIAVRGGPKGSYTFDSSGVRPGDGGTPVGLLFTSSDHFNRVIDGRSQPVPLGGPAGLRFLTRVFTPLSDLLGRYLRPTPEDLADPAFRDDSVRLTLQVVVAAVAVVGNEDRSGRVSAGQIPDGRVDLEVGDDLRHQLLVAGHRLSVVDAPIEKPRAALRFSDLETAGQVFSGEASAIGALSAGRISMRGVISMIDNVNRILDRTGQYLSTPGK